MPHPCFYLCLELDFLGISPSAICTGTHSLFVLFLKWMCLHQIMEPIQVTSDNHDTEVTNAMPILAREIIHANLCVIKSS